ncbi:cytochrome c oxidase subunit 6C-1-like [Thrips palmi]|uniref:Cytochrome c oxidase subunit 6C-1-like n=1 Tax=Thrips palmi TaxID=161013 RepID=A0A6P8ZP32_THRPL|nr:cytochrome c oxidase subunit 6C-1-like [Thrips palmi]
MSSAVTKLAKPQLRGHFQNYLNQTFIQAAIASAVVGVGFYFGILVKHRNRREEFYATFNAEKEFERLRDLGFFWSVPSKDPSKNLYNMQGEMP